MKNGRPPTTLFATLFPPAGSTTKAHPAAVLLSLGVYTAVAAATWAVMRLQADGGGGGLPWGG